MNISQSKIPFRDPEKADKIWQQFQQSMLHSDCRDLLLERLEYWLRLSVDPDMAIVNLERYFETCYNRTTSYDFLSRVPIALEIVVKICGESQFLSDVIVRNPDYLDWILEEGSLDQTKSVDEYWSDAEKLILTKRTFPTKMNAARRFHRRELLRIGVRDIMQLAGILDMAEELANLAEALTDAGVKICLEPLEKEYGIPQYEDSFGKKDIARFVVIGMGKLGGRELNFSSDIDLMFVYEEEGESTKQYSNHEFFSRLGTDLIKFLSQSTDQGMIYRVDMRLRPEGKSGPLSRSLDSYESYYQSFAETWERIALIKARGIGGDRGLGKQFEEMIQPFVYRRYLDYRGIEEIRMLKLRIQKEFADKRDSGFEIKSGIGGIREIEFYISTLQLLYGGKHPNLKIRSSCPILSELMRLELIRPEIGEFMITSYIFLRRVEQKLQLIHQLQTHHIPEDEFLVQKLARQLGYPDRDAFMNALLETTTGVHEIFLSLFAEESVSHLRDMDNKVNHILDLNAEPESRYEELKALGFIEPGISLQILRQLAHGSQEHIIPPEERRRLMNLLSELLVFLPELPNPDLGIRQFARFAIKYGSPRSLYSWLSENKETFRRLMMLLSSGEPVGNILISSPERLETILSPRQSVTPNSIVEWPVIHSRQVDPSPLDIRKSWDDARLTFASLDISNSMPFPELSRGFTLLAEQYLTVIIEQLMKRNQLDPSAFAVLGLGRLGSREFTFGSDLDLVFIYADEETQHESPDFANLHPINFYQVCDLVETIVREVNKILGPVDLRIRPEGDKGALAIPPAVFENYFAQRASFWERLAWLKSRYICGNPNLAERVLEAAKSFVFRPMDWNEAARETWKMRLKMQENSGSDEEIQRQLKSGLGGLVDIEFLVQYGSLASGLEPVLGRSVYDALQALHAHGTMDSTDYSILLHHHTFLTQLITRLRYQGDYNSSLLPEDEKALSILSRLSGISDSGELRRQTQQCSSDNRRLLKKYLHVD